MNDTNLPITGICLVTKPNNVPPGYDCIKKTNDDPNKNADLMADSLLERKDRFVCITRAWPLIETRPIGNERSFVLEDIKLTNERDMPPIGYSQLTHTLDTREKGTVRKSICVKMADRQPGMKCICDIVFLHKAKRPPQHYTIIGEINGLQMCVKEGTVPVLRAAPPVPNNVYPALFGGQMPVHIPMSDDYQKFNHYSANTISKKSDEKELLEGIPFEINPKYLQSMQSQRQSNGLQGFDTFRILSPIEIEQNFNYDFRTERGIF